MKKNISVIFLCFLAGLFGANITPLLTGTGKIVFPETSPGASISASAGNLNLTPGPNNASVVIANTISPLVLQSSPGQNNFLVGLNSVGEWTIYDYAAGAWTLGLYQTHGRVGVQVVPPAAYNLDVVGDIHTSTKFDVGAVTGLTYTATVRNGSNSASCVMQFTGGILNSSTC